MLSPQSRGDLLRRPALREPRLDLRQQPRTPSQLPLLRTPPAPLSTRLAAQRAIPIAPSTRPDLATHRRRRPSQPLSDQPTRLPSRDPTTDPLPLHKREPKPRISYPPTREHRRIPNPLHRDDRHIELRRDLSLPTPSPHPRRDQLTLTHTQNPTRLTPTLPPNHAISDLSTLNTRHVALTDRNHQQQLFTSQHAPSRSGRKHAHEGSRQPPGVPESTYPPDSGCRRRRPRRDHGTGHRYASRSPSSRSWAGSTGAGAPVRGSAPLAAFGNAITSRIVSRPASIATIRSTPIAIPPCGGAP